MIGLRNQITDPSLAVQQFNPPQGFDIVAASIVFQNVLPAELM